jgi:hypothetical protein
MSNEQYAAQLKYQNQHMSDDRSFNQDSNSMVATPNISYGGKKLQNQLEQVLMMKSGEFSAGDRHH